MNKLIYLIKQFRVEPFMFLLLFAGAVSSVTLPLLVQDKICVLEFKQSNDYCINLNKLDSNDDIQSEILVLSTKFSLYSTIIGMIPSVLWSVFIGSWCDKYIHGRKVLFCATALGGMLDITLVMINAYYFDLISSV